LLLIADIVKQFDAGPHIEASVRIPNAAPIPHSNVERFIIDVINIDEFIPVGGRALNRQRTVVLFSEFHKNEGLVLYLFSHWKISLRSIPNSLNCLVASNRSAELKPSNIDLTISTATSVSGTFSSRAISSISSTCSGRQDSSANNRSFSELVIES